MPEDATLNRTAREIHHYKQVQTGTKTETYQSYEKTGSHTETRTSYSNNGDGSFHRSTYTVTVPDYGYVTRTRTVPVYKDVPVYKTKYYYHIWRWRYNRTLLAKEHGDKKVYYRTCTLGEKERYGNQKVTYTVKLLNVKKDKTKKYTINKDLYKQFKNGKTYKVTIQAGTIKKIEEKE